MDHTRRRLVFNRSNHGPQELGPPAITGVQPAEILAPHRPNTQIDPSGSAGRTIVQSDESNLFGKPADVALGNAEGVVRGCVVDDDDFPVSQSLCENALQTFGEKAPAVVIRQNNRYDWRSHDGASVSGISHSPCGSGMPGFCHRLLDHPESPASHQQLQFQSVWMQVMDEHRAMNGRFDDALTPASAAGQKHDVPRNAEC